MANVPYSAGQSEVAPNAAPPDDYQRIQSSPADFGGQIAQGGEKLGQGAIGAGKFWGEVQVDGELNNRMQQLNDLAEHAKSLQGQDALNAQASIQDQKDQIVSAGRDALSTPEQQHRYDSTIRPFADRYISGQLSTHFVQQGRVHATNVNTDSGNLALNMIATNAMSDPDAVQHGIADYVTSRMKQLDIDGNTYDPTIAKATEAAAKQQAYKTYIEAVRAEDPAKAASLIEENADVLGAAAPALREQVRAQNTNIQAQTDGKTAWGNGASGPPAPGQSPAPQDQSTRPPNAVGQVIGADGSFVWTDKNGKTVAPKAGVQLPPEANGAPAPTTPQPAAPKGDAISLALPLLRHFEGLIYSPRWDINHQRIGYGSDTITRADGSVEPVTAFTGPITKEDAERDLLRRATLSRNDVLTNTGVVAWGKLTPQAQAALMSVSYN